MHPTGSRIRAKRLELKVSPERLAKAIGISRARYYKREEAGKFSDDDLSKIAALLKCTADDLRPPSRPGISPEQATLLRQINLGLQSSIQRHQLDLEPEDYSELFGVLHRLYSEAGHTDLDAIDRIVRIIKKNTPES